jgi:hypothetical protein
MSLAFDSDFCSGNGTLIEIQKDRRGQCDDYVVEVDCDAAGTEYEAKAYRTWFYFRVQCQDVGTKGLTANITVKNLNKQAPARALSLSTLTCLHHDCLHHDCLQHDETRLPATVPWYFTLSMGSCPGLCVACGSPHSPLSLFPP